MEHGPSGLRSTGVVVSAGTLLVAGLMLLGPWAAPSAAPGVPGAEALDPTFGDGRGIADIDPATGYRTVVRAVSTSDGSVLVNVASTDQNGLPVEPIAVARLDPSGVLDATWGDPSTPGFSRAPRSTAMELDGDGRLLVAGDGAVWRYSADGQLDLTFVSDDWPAGVPTPRPPTPGRVQVRGPTDRILVLPDGSIVVAGSGAPWSTSSWLTKLTPDGDLDPTFGDGTDVGVTTVPAGRVVGPVELDGGRLGVVPVGSVVVGTRPPTPSRSYLHVFDGDGRTVDGGDAGVFDLGIREFTAVDVDLVGSRLLVTGYRDAATSSSVMATDLGGGLDASWGDGGVVDLSRLGEALGEVVVWPARGQAGLEFPTSGGAVFRSVRFTDDGRLDASYGLDATNPGWLVVGLDAPPSTGFWLSSSTTSGGGLLGVGRRGGAPVLGESSTAVAVRTATFAASPDPRPLAPWSPPPAVTSTVPPGTTVPSPTTGPSVIPSTPTTSVRPGSPARIDDPASVGRGAVRIRP